MRAGFRYYSVGMVLRTLRTRLFRTPDVERWKDVGNHSADWDARTRLIASFVPAGSHVIDFGAGRCQLANWLPKDCTYTPSDIVDRGNDTLICDLNQKSLPALPRRATPLFATFSGVLEYVVDVPAMLAWLAPQVEGVIASYNCVPAASASSNRLQTNVLRLGAGWVNGFTESEFVALFTEAGFVLTEQRAVNDEDAERVYVFARPADQQDRATGPHQPGR